MSDRSARSLWETTLGQLELQVTRPNFDTWLRRTVGLRTDETTLVVGAPSDFALEWLRSRMSSQIARAVSQIAAQPLAVHFEVLGAPAVEAAHSTNSAAPDAAPAPAQLSLPLDQRLTFASFAVVNSNRLAYRAGHQIISDERSYNPLVLCGPHGLGKTHLLHAIAHEAFQLKLSPMLLTAAEFVNRYAESVRAGHPHTLRDAFRRCDVLLFDDLQFLATRPASQDLFSQIFNVLHSENRAIVVACESPPSMLEGLSASLRSRLQAGLTATLHPLSTPERRTILLAKARQLKLSLSEAVIDFIAEQPYQHIRELEGALNRLSAFADLSSSNLTLDAARQALFPLQKPPSPPSPSTILQTVSSHFHVSQDLLRSPSRSRDVTYARHIAMYLVRKHASRSLAEIGLLLGKRDHSTVLSGCQRITRELRSIPSTQADVEQLETALYTTPAA